MKSNSIASLTLSVLCMTAALCVQAQFRYGNASLIGRGGAGTSITYDYECVGVNPANLGSGNNALVAVGLTQVGVHLESEVLGVGKLVRFKESLSEETRQLMQSTFSDKGLVQETDFTPLAVSSQIPKVGGVSLLMRDRFSSRISLNGNGADLLFNGKNAAMFQNGNNRKNVRPSFLLDSTDIAYSHYREVALAYGRKITTIDLPVLKLNVYAGAAYKQLYGMSYQELYAHDASGELLTKTAFSGSYQIDYQNVDTRSFDQNTSLFNSAGRGSALDIGVNLGIEASDLTGDVVTIGLAITDMGKITWDQNVLQARNTTIDSVDVSKLTRIRSLKIKDIARTVLDSSGILEYEAGGEFETPLNSVFRAGVGTNVLNTIRLSADVLLPLKEVNGANLKDPYFIFGGDVKVGKILKVSSGFSGNAYYGINVPLGLEMMLLPNLQWQAALGDVVGLFSSGQHRVSAMFGLKFSVL